MSINKFNSEGCGSPVETSQPKAEKHRPNRQVRHYDPTTYEALTNIEKEERALRAFRPIVYICSPYAGDVSANVEKFCSDNCRTAWWNAHPEKVNRRAVYHFTCAHCGKPFTAYGNAKRKYCSHACYIADRYKGGDGHE